MIKLGKNQKLRIQRFTSIGAFLNTDEKKADDVLLPRKFVKSSWQKGDTVDVFVYKDNQNRMIATTVKPKLELGELAILKVVDVNKYGAFLDWGLEKDLLLPYEEQIGKVKNHSNHLVALYVDKSDRLAATMKVDPFFDPNPPYEENDWVEAQVYSFDYEIGAFMLVDNKYNAMLAGHEINGVMKVGDVYKLRVKNIKEDGKIDLTHNRRAHEEMGKDAEMIYNILKDNGGFMRVNDKSSPSLIRSVFQISKSQFKRAIGRLYKQRRIIFKDDGIMINRGGKNAE